MRTIGLILAKDLRQRLRDSSLLIYAVVLPLGLAFLFDAMLGGGDDGQRFSATYAVVDRDGGPVAERFVDEVLEPMARFDTVDVEAVARVDDARDMVENGDVDAAFVLPDGLTEDVAAGTRTRVEVIGDADAAIAVQLARELAEGFATGVWAEQLGVTGEPLLRIGEANETIRRELDSSTYFAAGMAVFFMLFVVMFGVTSIMDERKNGTLVRLLAAPIRPASVLAAKLLGSVVVGVVSMAVLVTGSSLLLGAGWGDPLAVAILVVAVVLAATGLMVLIAVFARTPEQASNWQSMVAILFGMLGGAFFPIAQLGVLGNVGYVTPHRWFLQGLTDLGPDGMVGIVTPVIVLLAIAIGSGTLAMSKAGRILQP